MKSCFLLSFVLLLNLISFSQDKEVIKQQAKKVAEATIKLDYETILNYTHPALIELSGGREALLKVVRSGMDGLASKGITIDSAWIGTPQEIFKAGSELHCLMPQDLMMKVPDGKLFVYSHLLGISSDKGANWTFINLSEELNNTTITEVLPNFNQDLKLPEYKKPVFVKD